MSVVVNIKTGLYLAVEASNSVLSIALCEIKTDSYCDVLYSASGTDSHRHAEELPAIFASGLEQIGASVAEVEGVIVGEGPGSFTGLRIGYSFAQGLCFASHSLLVVPTFPALAFSTIHTGLSVVVGDARRGEVFFGAFEGGGKDFYSKVPLDIKTPEQAVAEIEMFNEPDELRLIMRDDAQSTTSFQQLIEKVCQVSLSAPHEATALCAYVSSGCAIKKYTKSVEHASIVPHYLRKVAALTIEERAQKKLF
jgi:tRNA threonylcarbamoyl adenosine modification protein YeaZ